MRTVIKHASPEQFKRLAFAHQLLEQGQVDTALQIVSETLATAPLLVDGLHLMGLILAKMQKYRAALMHLTKALHIFPEHFQILNSRGNILSDTGKQDEAIADYLAAVEINPQYLDAWINLSLAQGLAHKWDEALVAAQRACVVSSNHPRTLSICADALRHLDRLDEAITMYQQALAKDPSRIVTRHNLAVALRMADKVDSALVHYESLTGTGFTSQELMSNHAAALLDAGQIDAALEMLDRAINKYPLSVESHELRVKIETEYVESQDPFIAYKSVAEQKPALPEFWASWTRQLVNQSRHEEIFQVCAAGRKAIGDQMFFKYAEAIAYSETGLADQALKIFEKLTADVPENAAVYVAFTRHMLRMQDAGRSIQLAQKALALSPGDQSAWAYLGTAWRMTGNPLEYWLHNYDDFIETFEISPAEYETSTEFIKKLSLEIDALHLAKYHPGDQTLRGGTQTAGALFRKNLPAIQQAKALIVEATQKYIAGLPDIPDHPLLKSRPNRVTFNGSWSVRLKNAGFHINHIHPQGWISSAYYLQLPPAVGAEDGRQQGWIQFGQPPVELGLNLSPRRFLQPKQGMLVLFPSSMWHGTVPFESGTQRLTVAFDIAPI
jgi:uncharacterized protein (TIGR02466 family)